MCKAAGLRRAQPRILRGAHDVRVGKLGRCDQQLTRAGIRQLRQPVLHRDAGCVRERTDVLVADDHVDLPLCEPGQGPAQAASSQKADSVHSAATIKNRR